MKANLWTVLKSYLMQEVPPELAYCEFECRSRCCFGCLEKEQKLASTYPSNQQFTQSRELSLR